MKDGRTLADRLFVEVGTYYSAMYEREVRYDCISLGDDKIWLIVDLEGSILGAKRGSERWESQWQS